MLNVKDLEDAIFAMQGPKLPKGIKVTTLFARYLESAYSPLEHKPTKHYDGFIGYYTGIPIEIDDEIDGPYEFVY